MPSNERAEYLQHHYDGRAQKFWSYYVSEAAQHDKHLTENWKGNMDSTLIFAGLFSAVVSAFIIESYKLLQEDSGDMTNLLLAQILANQVVALPSNSSSPPVIPTVTPSMEFIPSPAAITVNILWFLSLVCSLAAALMMILIQQWIRDYLQRIERSSDPLRRARDRIFLSNGMERWRMDVVVHYIPTLLHISLFLFFSGLYFFLAPINKTVTLAVIPIFLSCALLYGFITVAPLIDPSSPYETSFSSLFWRISQHVSQMMQEKRWNSEFLSPYLQRARNQLALNPRPGSTETDTGAFMWLYNQISNGKELERFLESLPEFSTTEGGYQVFSKAMHNEKNNTFIEALLDQLIYLIDYRSDSTLGQQAIACIEALSPIIIASPPKLLHRWLYPTSGSLYTTSISGNETLPMICFRALVLHHHRLFSSFRAWTAPWVQETSMSPIHVIGGARRTLEDVVASIEGDVPHLGDIQDLVQIYCATLESMSMELHRWSNHLEGPMMDITYSPHFSSSLQWFAELNSPGGVEFSCGTSTMVPEVDWGQVFHGPHLLAFMRATGALEPLHHIPQSSLTSHCQPSPEPGITSNGDLQIHFLREIHPLFMLLDLVGEKHQAWVTREPSKYDSVLQLVLRAFGPFDTMRFIFADGSKGSGVIALLELVMHLRQRPDLVVGGLEHLHPWETSHFHKTVDGLEIVESNHLDNLSSACSEHLFVGVLYALLTLEREAMLNSKPFVFSYSEMKHLISFIQYFQDSDALQIAKELLLTIYTTSEISAIPDNHPMSYPPGPPDLEQTRGQWKVFHNQIAEERLLALPQAREIPLIPATTRDLEIPLTPTTTSYRSGGNEDISRPDT